MTRDELTEAVARMIADHCCADSDEELERDTARAIVDMVMPAPLVWTYHGQDGEQCWRARGPNDTRYYYGTDNEGVHYAQTPAGESEHPTLAAAQSAAQAHADAAHIAGMKIAQEGR